MRGHLNPPKFCIKLSQGLLFICDILIVCVHHMWCLMRHWKYWRTSGTEKKLGFSKNSIFWKFSTCAVWVHILFLKYTFLWGPYMVLTHSKISSSYIKWKCKGEGVKISTRKYGEIFQAFHVEKSKILAMCLFVLEIPGKYFCSITYQFFAIFRESDKLSRNFCYT